MKWIIASERLPEKGIEVYFKCVSSMGGVDHNLGFLEDIQNALDWDWHQVLWLDESPPASAVEEAEKLYPYADQNIGLPNATYDSVMDVQRQAHIRCAGMYTDTIDKLKAENSKMRQALGRIGESDFDCSDKNKLVLIRGIAKDTINEITSNI